MKAVAVALGYHEQFPLERITLSRMNPRKTFDDAFLRELAESIKVNGMIEPLIARPLNGLAELVAGEQRYRAAQIAGCKTAPLVVREYSDEAALAVMLVENLKRRGLDPVEEGAAYRQLTKDLGWSVQQVCDEIGKKRRYVFQRMSLAESLAPESLGALKEKAITANHAILLSRIKVRAQQKQALEETIARQMSVHELDRWIKRVLLLKLESAPFDLKDATLYPIAGSCEECPRRVGNAPELWPDAKEKDAYVCTDRGCYDEKVMQHVNRELQSAREKGTELVQIVDVYDYWRDKPGHVLTDKQYHEIAGKADKCGSATKAIVVHGEKAGEKRSVCINPTCERHGKQVKSGRSDGEQERVDREREAKRKIDLARAVRGRVVDAILDAGTAEELSISWMENIAEAWWERLGQDVQRVIRKRHPEWDAETIPIGDLSAQQLVRLLMEFAMAGDLYVFPHGEVKAVSDELRDRAVVMGVDAAAIEKAVVGELAEGKKKGKKLAEVMAEVHGCGVEFETPLGVVLRLKKKTDPDLAHIDFHEQAGGWLLNVGVHLPWGKKATESIGESGPVWAGTGVDCELWASQAAALPAAHARLLELVERIEAEALATDLTRARGAVVRAWVERRSARV